MRDYYKDLPKEISPGKFGEGAVRRGGKRYKREDLSIFYQCLLKYWKNFIVTEVIMACVSIKKVKHD